MPDPCLIRKQHRATCHAITPPKFHPVDWTTIPMRYSSSKRSKTDSKPFKSPQRWGPARIANWESSHHNSSVIRLVLFDIDGTLIRTGGAGVKAFERVFEMVFGIPNATRRMSFAGRTDRSLVREFLKNHNIEQSESQFESFFSHYLFLLDQMLSNHRGEICTGIPQFIERIRQLPFPPALGLLTGNVRLGAEIKLRHHDLWDIFETGAFGDDHENRNELASIAMKRGTALLRKKLTGNEVLVIGDTPLDVECGKSIGANTIAVATGASRRQELLACSPDLAVNHLLEVDINSTFGQA